jgi:hypothetical protein
MKARLIRMIRIMVTNVKLISQDLIMKATRRLINNTVMIIFDAYILFNQAGRYYSGSNIRYVDRRCAEEIGAVWEKLQ